MRGIGPAYADKVSRHGIRTACLLNPEALRQRIMSNTDDINRRTEGAVVREGLTAERIIDDTLRYADRLRPMLTDTSLYLHEAWRNGKTLLLEGAQGTLLDIDFGTYPFATSSNNTVGGAFTGLGISPKVVDCFIGVAKAYATRVGNGPFPTELSDAVGERLREAGGEFGTTTGRPRRCGWLDLVALRYAVRVNGLDYLAITKMDVLDGMADIPVCTAYDLDGQRTDQMPVDMCALCRCRPILTSLPGWAPSSTKGLTQYTTLPAAAQKYLEYIEEFTGARIGIISTGAERHETIMRM